MKAAVYLYPDRHHEPHLKAMACGLQRHGISVEHFSSDPDRRADFAVVWSWRLGLRLQAQGWTKPILVMERGYVGDRFKWTSLGWNGLNGRATFPDIDDRRRWDENFGGLLKPWKPQYDGVATIFGQVTGDTALIGSNILKWYADTCYHLHRSGYSVQFRPHPVEIKRGRATPMFGQHETLLGDLGLSLDRTGLAVTFNSNSAVDALLAGVPTYTEDEGSMVWGITSHDLDEVEYFPRDDHFHRLAWKQWTDNEISSGYAWSFVKDAMEVGDGFSRTG